MSSEDALKPPFARSPKRSSDSRCVTSPAPGGPKCRRLRCC